MGFECKICNYKTTRKSNLERHRQSKKHQRLALIAQHSEITKTHEEKAKKPSSPKPVKENHGLSVTSVYENLIGYTI